MFSRKVLIGSLAATAAALTVVPAALSDQVFHTSHAALHSVAGAPLRSGFVNDIHTSSPIDSAREEYHLSGAQPDTSYQVQLEIFPTPDCAGAPFATVPTALLTTNGGGNGNANAVFPAGPPNNPPLQVGIVWQFLLNGVPAYATDCVPVTVD
jgi:hypothetical protein